MTPEQFAYWLQGFAELTPGAPTQDQWDSIRAHLQLVFQKKTPPVAPEPWPKTVTDAIRRVAQQPKPWPHDMAPFPRSRITC